MGRRQRAREGDVLIQGLGGESSKSLEGSRGAAPLQTAGRHTPRHPPSWGRGGRALPAHRKSGNPGGWRATTCNPESPLAHARQGAGTRSPPPAPRSPRAAHLPPAPAPGPRGSRLCARRSPPSPGALPSVRDDPRPPPHRGSGGARPGAGGRRAGGRPPPPAERSDSAAARRARTNAAAASPAARAPGREVPGIEPRTSYMGNRHSTI
nr:basic proline-rich protein-like [Dasypus novemcinctus]